MMRIKEKPPARSGDAPVKQRSGRFIPNVEQLNEAIRTLPDPELCAEATYTAVITVDDRRRRLEFTRKRINRGSARPYRWIFEGKVLIRRQDMGGS
ncbi:MAG: hypothetical protein ACOCVJ_00700 [Verrucomicrobiota bacterium]